MTSKSSQESVKERLIFDATPIIYADLLGYIPTLNKLYRILITPEVERELREEPDKPGGKVPELSYVYTVTPKAATVRKVAKVLKEDPGETESLALALDTGLKVVLDEAMARNYAKKNGVAHTGLLGLLLLIHDKGLEKRQMRTEMKRLRQGGFYLSEKLVQWMINQ